MNWINDLSHKRDAFEKWEWNDFILHMKADWASEKWNETEYWEFYWAVEWYKKDFLLKFEQTTSAYLNDAIIYAIQEWKRHTIWHRTLLLEAQKNEAIRKGVLSNIESMSWKMYANEVFNKIMAKIS